MSKITDKLKDHPIQSILTGLASVATILGFLMVFKAEGSKTNTQNLQPGMYNVNRSNSHKVYFHNSPDISSRRAAYFSTQEVVTITKVENGFGYVSFENDRGQKSFGWLDMRELVAKP
jgi:hypothetical protein